MCLIQIFTAVLIPTGRSRKSRLPPSAPFSEEGEKREIFLRELTSTVSTAPYPELYAYQDMLPYLPLPGLGASLKRLRDSLSAFADQANFPPDPTNDDNLPERYQERLTSFEKKLGPQLQMLLQARKMLLVDNYVSDWWERYVYCMSRKPLPINSNYYILDMSHFTPTSVQSARAATLLHHFLKFNQLILEQTLAPIKVYKTVPVCMDQYRRMFSTIRRPGHEFDSIVHYQPYKSQHVVVICRGQYYSVNVASNKIPKPPLFDTGSEKPVPFVPLAADDLQFILERIMDDSKNNSLAVGIHPPQPPVNSLTALTRNEWASVRKNYFSSGLNAESLHTVESSIMILVLQNDTDNVHDSFEGEGQFALGGAPCWHDKSINLVIMANGRMALHCEHSYADAPVVAHAHEYALSSEVINDSYDSNGNCKKSSQAFVKSGINNGQNLDENNELVENGGANTFKRDVKDLGFRKVEWDFSSLELVREISKASAFASQNRDNVDLCVRDFSVFGKGAMKRNKISPDAFVQVAIQLAYYTAYGKLAMTYEASTTRLFLRGRTETVRSLTNEVATFVRAFGDCGIKDEEKVVLFRRATKKHQELYKDAMTGKGCDRHLFALYVMSRMIGKDSSILKEILSIPWTLSTSQSPQRQIKTNFDFDSKDAEKMLSPGGGFGPVKPDGYGIAYMFPSNNKLFFHVSSLKSSNSRLSSSEFCDQIFASLQNILACLDGAVVSEN